MIKPQEYWDLFQKKINLEDFQKSLITWFHQNKAQHPWRTLWNQTHDIYYVWLSEIMLQQTTIATVTPRFLEFIKKYPSAQDVAESSEHEVLLACQGLGYYRRFRLFYKGIKSLYHPTKKQMLWPQTPEEWLHLSGIGKYTQAAITSVLWNTPLAVSDGNVERVLLRLMGLKVAPNEKGIQEFLYQKAQEILFLQDTGNWNQAIMELGQTLCNPHKPQCISCPLQKYCLSFLHNIQNEIPLTKLKKDFINIHMRAYIILKDQKIALFERNSDEKFLKNSIGFPFDEHKEGTHLGVIKHTITHHKIRVDILESHENSFLNLKYYLLEEIPQMIHTSLDKKILQFYIKNKKA